MKVFFTVKNISPLRAIRKQCCDCRAGRKPDVIGCTIPDCPLYPLRSGHRAKNTDGTTISPVKSIRAKCLDCCSDQPNEVRLCPCTDCFLYPFRFGKNPNIPHRTMSPEQRAKATEQLRRYLQAGKIDSDAQNPTVRPKPDAT